MFNKSGIFARVHDYSDIQVVREWVVSFVNDKLLYFISSKNKDPIEQKLSFNDQRERK